MMRNRFAILSCLILALVAGLAPAATTYDYDQLGRLVRVTYGDGSQIDYSYDLAGNRTARSVTGASSATGTVQIVTDPDTVAWSFSDSTGAVYQGTGDDTVGSVAAGVVTLYWSPPAGYGAPVPNPAVKTLFPGGTAVFEASVVIAPPTPTRTQTPVPTSTPSATPTPSPTSTPTPRVTPSQFTEDQDVWFDATGGGFVYVSAWDYVDNKWLDLWVTVDDEVGALTYQAPPDHWIGIFVYDLSVSGYTHGMYVLRQNIAP